MIFGTRSRAVFTAILATFAMLLAGTAYAGGGGVENGGGKDGRTASSGGGGKYRAMWNTFERKDKRWAHKTSECESGHDPDAVNRSGPYYGAFQFLKSTWRSSPRSPGGKPTRYNWKTQAVVAVKLKHRDGKGHWPNCG